MIRVRMSQAGYCPRRLGAMLLGRDGAPIPTWLNESADEGNWHEARMKDELRALGCEVTDEQLEVRLSDRQGYEAVGHIDGRVKPSRKLFVDSRYNIHYIDCSSKDITDSFFDEFHLGEMKTFSYLEHQRWVSEVFDNYFQPYGVQHTLYRVALKETGITMLFSKDRSGGARNLYLIGRDPANFPELCVKLDKVVTAAEQGDLVFAEYDPERLECRRCNYKVTQCLGKLPQINEIEAIAAAEDYLAGAAAEKEGKALKEIARDVLIAQSKRLQKTRWAAGIYPITYSSFPREDAKTAPVHAVIDELSTIIESDIMIKTELLKPVVQHLQEAISVSVVNRITVTNPNKED